MTEKQNRRFNSALQKSKNLLPMACLVCYALCANVLAY